MRRCVTGRRSPRRHSKLRARVLDVLREEGYIRGYAEILYGGGKTEFEIELKYYDGTAGHPRN